MNEPIDLLVRALALAPHPEGGFYRETYRAEGSVQGRSGARAASTAIYYLLRRDDFSALHRIASDEVWHFYSGASLTVHCLHEDGRHEAIRLGRDLARGEVFQAVVPAGAWFGARIEGEGEHALVGCTVAPGFDFADFELAERAALTARFPTHAALIFSLTRA